MGGGGPAAPRRPQEVLDAVPASVDMALSATVGVAAATCVGGAPTVPPHSVVVFVERR